jgi:hemoglobin-like flavoprotein
MGLFHSRVADDLDHSWTQKKPVKFAEFEEKTAAIDPQVEHYMPPTFPLIPIVTPRSMQLCKESWNFIIQDQEQENEYHMMTKVSGMTLFYTEFYELLDRLDPAGAFDAVLSAHSGGQNKIAAKGSILIRIVQYSLNLDFTNQKQVDFQLYMLGKAHCQKAIRPWMYSIFIQCFLNTIGHRLGSKATSDVMGAWVNLFSFILRKMLPHAIKGKIIETEFNAVVTQNVLNEDVTNQINNVQEEKEVHKRFDKTSETRSVGFVKSPPLTRNGSFNQLNE